jgi:hypothetical protein
VVVDPASGGRKTICKVRGIALNYTASQLVNFDVIKDFILNGEESATITVHGKKDQAKEGGRKSAYSNRSRR